MTLFGEGSRGGVVKSPRKRSTVKNLTPVWRAVHTKTAPPCKTCLKFQHETWRDGKTPYRARGTTRNVRVVGDVEEFYCDVHAADLKLAEKGS